MEGERNNSKMTKNADNNYNGGDNDNKAVMQQHSGDPESRLGEAEKGKGRNDGEDLEDVSGTDDGAEGHAKDEGGEY